jgi:hypothetical protein
VCRKFRWRRGFPFDPIAEGKLQWEKHRGPDAVSAMGAVTSIIRAQQILLGRLNPTFRRVDEGDFSGEE